MKDFAGIIKTLMTKQSIAIDLDDVLAAHAEAFVQFSNELYKTDLTVDDYTDYWSEIWQVEEEEVERRSAEFHTPGVVMRFGVKDEALDTLRRLKEHYELFVVTARRKKLIDITQEWLDKEFSGIFLGVHFVPIWEPNNTITKAEISKEIGAIYLIDDLVQHCNLAAEAGIQALLFGDYSWNRSDPLHEDVIRIKDWQSVASFFNL